MAKVKKLKPNLDAEYFGSQWQIEVRDTKIKSSQVAEIMVGNIKGGIIPTHEAPIQLESAMVADGKAKWILKFNSSTPKYFSKNFLVGNAIFSLLIEIL